MITTFENFKESKREKKTTLVSAFPGTGKTRFFKNTNKKVLDSDSSTFDKKDFPNNYIKHIKDNIGKVDIILISSHKDVRDALVKEGLDFTLVYPKKELKDEYIKRYKERGSPESFIELLSKKWNEWIEECKNQKGCKHIELDHDKYLSDVL